MARDVNVGFCRPPDWEASEENINGLIAGYVSPDQTSGMFILRLPAAPGEDTQAAIETELDSMDGLRELFLPDTVGALDAGTALDDYFLGFSVAGSRDYRYPGGLLRAGVGAGPEDSGSFVYGVIFGPEAMFEAAESPGPVLFTSMLRLE